MGKKNVSNLFKGSKPLPQSHGGSLTHSGGFSHKSGANGFKSTGTRTGTGFAATNHGSGVGGAGGKLKVDSILGYASKFGDAMEGLEKAIALAKYGMEMVSSSFPTEDLNQLASQLETALADANRGVMETLQQVPETRFLCADTLGHLNFTMNECREYLTMYRQRWAVDRSLERKEIAEKMGALYRRLRKDALAYWKEARKAATSRQEKPAGEMQMVPARYNQGWTVPAAGVGGEGSPGIPAGPMPMPGLMVAPATNAQRYGAPFGFSDAAMAAMGSAGRGGLPGVPMGAPATVTGPAAFGRAGPYGFDGRASAAQQGAMFPYQGPSQVPLGAAAATAAAAFAASAKKASHQGYAPKYSHQPRIRAMQGPAAAPGATPALAAAAAAPGATTALAAPASAVQWDYEGRLHYFHPAFQRWYFCPTGADQGRPFYLNPITEEKYFGFFPNAPGW